MDRGAWPTTNHGVKRELDTTERLNDKSPLTWSQDQPSESFQIRVYFLLLYLYMSPRLVLCFIPWLRIIHTLQTASALTAGRLQRVEGEGRWRVGWSPCLLSRSLGL